MSSGLPILLKRLGQRPGRVERAVQAGIEDRAAVDRNDVVRNGRGKADLEHVVCAEPRMQRDAAAADAMCIDQRRHLAFEFRLPQRLDDESVLPGAVARPVCQCWIAQPPQTPKCGQNGVIRSGLANLDRKQPPAVGMAVDFLHLDGLAAKRVGHVDRLTAAK